MSHTGRGWFTPAAAAAAVLLGIYLAGTGAVYFRPEGSSVAFWWPAAGLAVALVATMPRSWTPGLAVAIAVVSAAANLTGGQTVELSLAYGLANAVEATIAGLALKDASGHLVRLTQLSDFVRLLVAALAGALALGLIAASAAALLGEGEFVPTLRNLVASHTAATMVIVPVVMAWRHRSGPARRAEYVAQVAALVVATAVVFGLLHSLPVSFAVLPFLVWAALRLDPRTVTLELLLSCLVAVLLTAQGRGPFGDVGGGIPLELAAPLVQGYIFATTLVALPLTLAVTQRAEALAELTERERLFRRNFTESMTGMVLLVLRGDRLEIVDANDTALQLLDDGRTPVMGRYLDRVLTGVGARCAASAGTCGPASSTAGAGSSRSPTVPGATSRWRSRRSPAATPDLLGPAARRQRRVRRPGPLRRRRAADQRHPRHHQVHHHRDRHDRHRRPGQPRDDHDHRLPGARDPGPSGLGGDRPAVPGAASCRRCSPSPTGPAIPGTREANAQSASGETLRVVWNNDLVRDEDGTPRYAVMTGVDVTAERTTAGLMTNLFQAGISTAIIGIDSRGRITLFNAGAEALLGWTAEQVIGSRFTDLLEPEELAEPAPTPMRRSARRNRSTGAATGAGASVAGGVTSVAVVAGAAAGRRRRRQRRGGWRSSACRKTLE